MAASSFDGSLSYWFRGRPADALPKGSGTSTLGQDFWFRGLPLVRHTGAAPDTNPSYWLPGGLSRVPGSGLERQDLYASGVTAPVTVPTPAIPTQWHTVAPALHLRVGGPSLSVSVAPVRTDLGSLVLGWSAPSAPSGPGMALLRPWPVPPATVAPVGLDLSSLALWWPRFPDAIPPLAPRLIPGLAPSGLGFAGVRESQEPVEILTQYALGVLVLRASQIPVEIATQYTLGHRVVRVSQVSVEIIYPFGCHVFIPPISVLPCPPVDGFTPPVTSGSACPAGLFP